jgi:hypothetical protein
MTLSGLRLCAALAVGWVVGIAAPARAADEPPAAGACKAMGFLAGTWRVTSGDGARVAEITWAPSADGCVLKETGSLGTGAAGFLGVMAYSRQAGDWSYFAVQPGGVRERFDRGVWDGQQVRFVRSEPAIRSAVRLDFAPLPDGRIREVAELSDDGGRSWAVRYDLTWTRRP